MRPDRGTRALRDVIGALMDTADGAGYFAGRVSGVEQRLALGESHALLGRSAPDLQLADGRRLAKCLRTGAALLLAFEAAPVLQAQAARWAGRVQWLQGEVRDRAGAKALLVRPDGIVAWVLGEDGVQSEALESVLCHWFGLADATATQPAVC
ncbi:MAG: Anhydrotetracycline monooxygenase [Stenotrophomonas maltophilia]|nr:MAG: Anhydrotetracycline monooxygenase [Stenotrophomonas maltophilia]